MLAPLALQATITLAPASMSLPDLAAALTRAGMPTECSPALRERGALVSLHRRSPEATRKALAEALGVAFVQEGEGWRMVVDDAARTRDARLLGAYEALAARAAAAWAEAERKARGGLDYGSFAAKADRAAEALRDGRSTDDAVFERFAPVASLVRRAQPNAWIAAAAMGDATFVRQAIESGTAKRTIPAASVERTTGVPLAAYAEEARRSHADLTRAETVTVEATFDPLQGTLAVRSYLLSGGRFTTGARTFRTATGYEMGGTDGLQVKIGLEPETVDATLDAMGPEGVAYRKTLAPTPDLPERPVLQDAPWTLSSGLERLCALGGGNLAMALSPRFEFSPLDPPGGAHAPALSFRSAFAPKAGIVDGRPDHGYDAEKGVDPATGDARRGRSTERKRPWRAVDRNGVWLVVDPYGFLDRARPVSPVPFLQAERALREQGGGAIPDAPTIATARRIGRAIPWPCPRELREALGYRDLGLRDEEALLGMLRRLDGATPAAQDAFWRDLRTYRVATVETLSGAVTLRLNGVESAPNVVGGYLFPGTSTGGADLGYVRFDGRGSVSP